MTPRIPSLRLLPLLVLAAIGTTAGASPAFADTAADQLASARSLLAQNNREQALSALKSAVAANPSSAEAYTLLATACLRYGLPDEGLSAAQTALKLSTAPADKPAATFLLGRAQLLVYQEKRLAIVKKYSGKGASRDLENQMSERSYDLPQGSSPTGSGLGTDASIPDNAVNADVDQPGDVTAQNDLHRDNQELIDALHDLDRSLREVETSFRDTQAADPSYPDAHDGLGLILVMEGKQKDAITQFQAEIQRDPADLPALVHLAGVQAQQGDNKGAILTYRRVVRLSPRDESSYAHLAELYSTQKDSPDEQWARGMALLLLAGSAPQDDAKIKYSQAEAAFANVKTPTPAILRGQTLLALAQNKPDVALSTINKAIALAPTDAESLVMLGDIQLSGSKLPDALKTYASATANDPTNDAAWYGLGLVQDKMTDPKDAITAYAKAIAANPNNASARLDLAADQADAGMKTDAITNLREYQRRFPQARDAADVEAAIEQLSAA